MSDRALGNPLVLPRATSATSGSGTSLAEVGEVSAFARDTAPDGWLKANGALVSRQAYARLFSVIGTTFGAGDGSTTFALPDLRGEFIRGWSDGRAVDSGRAFGSQQASGNALHSHSASASQGGSHTHSVSGTTGGGAAHGHQVRVPSATANVQSGSSFAALTGGSTWVSTSNEQNHTHSFSGTAGTSGSDHSHSVSVFSSGLNETTQGGGRPRNIALLYCIKY